MPGAISLPVLPRAGLQPVHRRVGRVVAQRKNGDAQGRVPVVGRHLPVRRMRQHGQAVALQLSGVAKVLLHEVLEPSDAPHFHLQASHAVLCTGAVPEHAHSQLEEVRCPLRIAHLPVLAAQPVENRRHTHPALECDAGIEGIGLHELKVRLHGGLGRRGLCLHRLLQKASKAHPIGSSCRGACRKLNALPRHLLCPCRNGSSAGDDESAHHVCRVGGRRWDLLA
mmetsp:Transcript_98261/g.316627  ORF Transcript_98261/g.316627 Transcript_98261/m.316627 type:complete len:225 (+) Transcript_98261:1055-1729(+)